MTEEMKFFMYLLEYYSAYKNRKTGKTHRFNFLHARYSFCYRFFSRRT